MKHKKYGIAKGLGGAFISISITMLLARVSHSLFVVVEFGTKKISRDGKNWARARKRYTKMGFVPADDHASYPGSEG